MGGVVGGITDAIGLTDYEGQREAQEAANRNAEAGLAMSKDQLEFMKQQYNDWNEVFGYQGIAGDLGTYFKNLTGDSKTAQQLVQLQKAEQQALDKIKVSLDQRGISGSGIEGDYIARTIYQSELNKANVKANTESQVAAEKMGFLGLGLGQGSAYLGMVGSAGNTAVNASMNAAQMYNANYMNLNQSNMNTMGSIVGMGVGYGLSGSSNTGQLKFLTSAARGGF